MVSLQHDLLTDPHQNPNGKLAEKPHGTPDVILKSSASQQPPKMAPFPRYVAGESGRSADFFQHKLRGWCNDFRKRLIGGAYRCYISGDILSMSLASFFVVLPLPCAACKVWNGIAEWIPPQMKISSALVANAEWSVPRCAVEAVEVVGMWQRGFNYPPKKGMGSWGQASKWFSYQQK